MTRYTKGSGINRDFDAIEAEVVERVCNITGREVIEGRVDYIAKGRVDDKGQKPRTRPAPQAPDTSHEARRPDWIGGWQGQRARPHHRRERGEK